MQVAIYIDVFSEILKLPREIQNKVSSWMVRFQVDPKANGINYETIESASDSRMRSVRIDQSYRGIVLAPDEGQVYMLLHVDKHDPAYKWARTKRVIAEPGAGGILVVPALAAPGPTDEGRRAEVVEARPEAVPVQTEAEAPAALLFPHVHPDQARALGVPEELINPVLDLTSRSGLDDLRPALGVGCFDALNLVADGFTVDEVLEDMDRATTGKVSTSDLGALLQTPETLSAFFVPKDEQELRHVLDQPLAMWRIFLHPKQRRLACLQASGPMRVLGGAGTGKTVLAMHRAKWLAESFAPAGRKVLFTTFTRNLADDIRANLETLCSKETMARIDVMNLDRWVMGYLQARSYTHRIEYSLEGPAGKLFDRAKSLRDTALPLPDDFYEREWEQVVAAHGITTLDQYRQARRTGRGGNLTRKQRDAIWPVFEQFRSELAAQNMKMVEDAFRDAADLLAGDEGRSGYAAIIVDETQDLGPMALRLLRAMVPDGPNDLFFVGDGHQRIYKRNRAAMGRCGIRIVGRSRKLNLNYRTTDEIRAYATQLLEGYAIDDLDGGTDTSKGYVSLSHGPVPDVVKVDSLDAALTEAVEGAIIWHEPNAEVPQTQCIIVPSAKVRDDVGFRLKTQGIDRVVIKADQGDIPNAYAVRLATMHRAKGLEFDRVTVIVSRKVLEEADADENQRKLLYVSLTRAKREARIVAY